MKRYCCDHLCEQGRLCPDFMPAEAANEIGIEDEEKLVNHWFQRMMDFFAGVGLVALVFAVAFWFTR